MSICAISEGPCSTHVLSVLNRHDMPGRLVLASVSRACFSITRKRWELAPCVLCRCNLVESKVWRLENSAHASAVLFLADRG